MKKIARLRRKIFFPDARAQIVVMDPLDQSEMPMHRHEFAELVIVLSGKAVHSTGRVRHRLQAGDILFINSSRSHAYEETRGLSLVNILVREDVFHEAERNSDRCRAITRCSPSSPCAGGRGNSRAISASMPRICGR